jgi:hypothetical protein
MKETKKSFTKVKKVPTETETLFTAIAARLAALPVSQEECLGPML